MDKGHGEADCFTRQNSSDGRKTGAVTEPNGSRATAPDSELQDIPSSGHCDTMSVDHQQHSSSVRKSKTHDCLSRMALGGVPSPEDLDQGQMPTAHRLVSSASFSGFDANPHKLRQKSQSASGCNGDIIDYRNLTPHPPFVPSIAKSIPKKRISLRKSRKAIKDLFGMKRNKHEKVVSPCTPCHRTLGNSMVLQLPKRTGRRDRLSQGSKTPDELHESLSDSSSESSGQVCDDSASLKSFGSQAGCGEIFADEDNLTSLESVLKRESNKDSCEFRKRGLLAAFQGGKEQLASPAHTEVLDLFGMWDNLNRAILSNRKTRTEGSASAGTPSVHQTPSPSNTDNIDSAMLTPIETVVLKAIEQNMVTPKSETQETTSDEGYCDYVSPGLEEQSKGSLTPTHSIKFPRDTYSGDALYELFYDPSEAEMTPVFDDEMDPTHSIIGQTSDLPLSMYSFHVGAEENLAPPFAVDLISQEFLQSNWVGKECLLKLCDTEISLAMGIVSWLRQRPIKESVLPQLGHVEVGDSYLNHAGAKTTEVKEILAREIPETVDSNNGFFKETRCQKGICPVSEHAASKRGESVLSKPGYNNHTESQPRTPKSGLCFRIFNIHSPLTPDRDFQSPVLESPRSGTSSVFVLAINRQSLCETCRSMLKPGAKELHLCTSCISHIEHIKTSEVWGRGLPHDSQLAGTPQAMMDVLPSPISTCRIGSDISLASLVEQCASQMSAMHIYSHQNLMYLEQKAAPRLDQDTATHTKKEQSKKNLKSKHMMKGRLTGRGSSLVNHGSHRSNYSDGLHRSSMLEADMLDLVPNNGSDGLISETYESPSSSNQSDISQLNRPTSLPLTNSTLSEFTRSKDSKAKEKPRERLRRHKKSHVNRHGLCGHAIPEESKVEHKRKTKR